MNRLKNYILIVIIGLFIFIVIGFLLINKTSYSVDKILDTSGLPKTSFNTNYTESTSNINYISKALNGNNICTNYCHNFSFPNNYKDSSLKLPLYLLMKNMKIPKNTETFEILADNPNEISDPGLIYIINHGYNITNTTKNIFNSNTYPGTINNDIKQYITQIALWLYIYENGNKFTTTYCMPTNTDGLNACSFYAINSTNSITAAEVRNIITTAYNVNGYSYLKYIIDLVNSAEAITSYEESSMSSIPDVNSYTINSNGTLLTTDLFTATPSTNKDNFMYYTVKIDDPNGYGAYIVDQNNAIITNKSAISGGFKVVIPLSDDVSKMDLRSISVTINGYFAANKAYDHRVTQTNGAAILNQNKKQVFSNISLAYIPEDIVTTKFNFYNIVQISKKDFTNKEELPGAVLEIKNSKGDLVDTWTSTNIPHYLHLENGDYSLCEKTQPEGYVLNTECVNFNVDGTKITTVEMFNKVLIPNTDASINKFIYFIGFIILITGCSIITVNLKRKKLHQ